MAVVALAGLMGAALAVETVWSSEPVPAKAERPARPELSLPRLAEYDYNPPAPGSYHLPVIKLAGDGRVVGPDGKDASLHDLLRGRISLMSFIYTRCGDPRACPRATGTLYQLHRLSKEDPVLAENLRLVTFSFDPEHDTPEVMKIYGRGFQSEEPSADWFFLTTRQPADMKPILEAYGQEVDRKKNPKDPMGPLYHNLRVFLIDRQGRIRNIYSYGMMDPRLLITDVRTLLMEEAGETAVDGQRP